MEHGQLDTIANGATTPLGQTADFLRTRTVGERITVGMDENPLELNEDAERCSWQMRRQCNGRLPFLHLPIEILIRILSLALNRDGRYVNDLLRLSRVCHYIHSIIEQTPSLWAYLDTGFRRATFNRVLSMSATALLDISIAVAYITMAVDYKSTLNFLSFDRLLTTGHRWRSVSIHNLDAPREWAPQTLVDICLQPAPMLAALELKDLVWPEADGAPFGGITPKLSLVRVNRVEFPWDRLMLQGLRELELRNPLGLSVHALFSILATCPGLRRLDLSWWEDRTANGSIGLPSLIQLPSLSHLRIFKIMYKTALQILTRISTPVLQILEFAVEMTPEWDAIPILRCITPFIRIARERKSWEGCVFTLVLNHREVVLWLTQPDIGDSDPRLIGISRSPLSISLPPLLQTMSDISPEQAVHIHFNFQPLMENADDVLNSLWPLQNTTKVFSSTPYEADRPLNFLGTPRQSDQGIYQWPFPKLSVVDIPASTERIRRMVEGRYGLGLPKDAIAELPAPLQGLTLAGLVDGSEPAGLVDGSELRKIEELVGDGIVQHREL